MRQLTIILVLWVFSTLFSPVSAQKSDGVAYQDRNVRFTVITPGVIRLEYSRDGQFVDNPSFVASRRKYAPTVYQIQEKGPKVVITTSKMVLTYKKGRGGFNEKNLTITSAPSLATQFTWHPGDKQKANLKGTCRTLDGFDGDRYWSWDRKGDRHLIPLEDGILARDGWTVIDDSNGLLFDGDVNDTASPDLPWVMERKEGGQDLYFMAYGHDYKSALSDFTQFAGKIPMPPLYAFGYWWSRYWSYSDAEMRDLLQDFQSYDIPLDVLVVDMDWHWTEQGKGGWTGYTWNNRLFPNPSKFLEFLKSKDLSITLNLHPADGVPAYEDKYKSLARFLGRDPESKETIRYQGSDKQFIRGWLDKMLLPLEQEGVTFWWLDWQQSLYDDSIKSLSNTWWLNYCVFDNQVRNRPNRPMLYHRWGGLGNHRYQIGFSGDSFSSWETLDFQPYFNITASNVCYGYWSHDLGGHMLLGKKLDPELYTRWMQLGAYMPVMRSHSTKDSRLKKEPWELGQPYMPIVISSIHQHYKMVPYVYAAAREAHESGISVCRPLYYDYPENEESYAKEFRNEYMYGNSILVCPITSPMTDSISTKQIYLPEGEWYEVATGTLLKGGRTMERKFLIDEYPVYVKAGAVIPTFGHVRNLSNRDEKVIFEVYPQSEAESTVNCVFYEDNGNDKDYDSHYATTAVTSRKHGRRQTITIGKREGNYPGMPKSRQFALRLLGAAIPSEVRVDGKNVSCSYDGSQLAACVELGSLSPQSAHVVEITYPSDVPELNDGLVGQFRRMKSVLTAMKYRDAGIVLLEGLGEQGSIIQSIEYYPEQFNSLIHSFRRNYASLPALLDKQRLDETSKKWVLKAAVYK